MVRSADYAGGNPTQRRSSVKQHQISLQGEKIEQASGGRGRTRKSKEESGGQRMRNNLEDETQRGHFVAVGGPEGRQEAVAVKCMLAEGALACLRGWYFGKRQTSGGRGGEGQRVGNLRGTRGK